MPTHMAILVIASSLYRTIATPDSGPFSITWTFVVTDFPRALGLLILIAYFCLYQKYHSICVEARQAEMATADLADGMIGSFSKRSWKNALDVIWIPFVAPLYGSIPAFYAQLSHFWTTKLVMLLATNP